MMKKILIGILLLSLVALIGIYGCGEGVREVATTTTTTTSTTTTTTTIISGVLDTTFGTGGIVVHNNAAGGNNDDDGYGVTIDSSGRILVAGDSRSASLRFDMVIWRYNSDGSLDTTFDTDGIVVHNNAAGGNQDDYGDAIITDDAGRILVVGNSRNAAGNRDMVIWRYNPDGSLDTTFDTDGIVVHHNAAGGDDNDNGYGVYIDSSGRIVVVGSSVNVAGNSDMVIWRYNSDGSLDTTFDTDGIVVHSSAAGGDDNDNGYGVYIDSSGRIVVVGSSVNVAGNSDMVIWRYNSDGSLDTTFDTDGIVVHSGAAGGDGSDFADGVTLDSSGRIVVVGASVNAASDRDMVIWRYNPDGSPDTTFGTDGVVVHTNAAGGDSTDYGVGIAIDSSERILVAGGSRNEDGNYDMVIWRYNPDGSLDTTFGTDGVVVHNNAAGGNDDDFGEGMVIDSSGRIVVAGSSKNVSDFDMVIWRYR